VENSYVENSACQDNNDDAISALIFLPSCSVFSCSAMLSQTLCFWFRAVIVEEASFESVPKFYPFDEQQK
jgi:hypothetical protein